MICPDFKEVRLQSPTAGTGEQVTCRAFLSRQPDELESVWDKISWMHTRQTRG